MVEGVAWNGAEPLAVCVARSLIVRIIDNVFVRTGTGVRDCLVVLGRENKCFCPRWAGGKRGCTSRVSQKVGSVPRLWRAFGLRRLCRKG